MQCREGFCALCLAASAYLLAAEFHETTHPPAYYARPAFTRHTGQAPEHVHQEFERAARISRPEVSVISFTWVSNSIGVPWEASAHVHSHEEFARSARIHEQTAAIGPRHYEIPAEGGAMHITGGDDTVLVWNWAAAPGTAA